MKKEDIAYFKEHEGYVRLFKAIRNKYKSIGRIGGIIKLDNIKDSERDVLSNHFKKDYSKKKYVNVDISKFEQSLLKTRFEEYTLLEILENFFNEKFTSKKEDNDEFKIMRGDFFNELIKRYDGTKCLKWITKILDEAAIGVRTINQRYINDKVSLKIDMTNICDALNNLPLYRNEKKRLPVFASQITRNPHRFDINTECGSMFKNALCTITANKEVKGAEETAELYYSAGIMIDEISNYVTISGLLAYNNGKENQVFKSAFENGEILQIPLYNLSKIDSLVSTTNKVYVVENPGVFTSIIDCDKANPNTPLPLVCTYGQPKLASLVLLDLLYKGGTCIYYSGDFDPEGLLIAERLYQRYKDRFYFLGYDIDDYMKALSNEMINDIRLKKLDNIESNRLNDVIDEMKRIKKAGYQELILDEIIKSIIDLNNR